MYRKIQKILADKEMPDQEKIILAHDLAKQGGDNMRANSLRHIAKKRAGAKEERYKNGLKTN